MWRWLLVALAGFGSGVLASVVGIGGAVVTTPLIRLLGASPIHAVGSTVPAILPGSISGATKFAKEGLVNVPVSLVCGVTGVATAVAGAWTADVVNARFLMVLTALLAMWSGVSLFRRGTKGEADAAPSSEGELRGGLPGAAVLGVVAGFLAGLLGVGGGIVLVPGLTLGMRMSARSAVATSLTAVAVMSASSLVTHIALGHIDWNFALPLAVGVVPGARVGARFTIAADERRASRVAGAALTMVAAVYLTFELVGLR